MDNEKPINDGDRIQVKVVNPGRKAGSVVAKYPAKEDDTRGYTVFIQNCNAEVGTVLSVVITKSLEKYAFSEEDNGQ